MNKFWMGALAYVGVGGLVLTWAAKRSFDGRDIWPGLGSPGSYPSGPVGALETVVLWPVAALTMATANDPAP
jgi:hypothetical protein